MFKEDKLWVSWQEHRRTESICRELDIPLEVLYTRKKGIARYLGLCVRTIVLLKAKKPKNLIVQNPSIILSVLAVLLRPVFGYQLIVDAHNEGVEPYVNNSAVFRTLTRWLHRRSEYTIVTNRQLAGVVKKNRGTPVILPDALPELAFVDSSDKVNRDEVHFTLIATFAEDEPVEEILTAFSRLDANVTLSVTGNYKKLDQRVMSLSTDKVLFTGFLSENDYLKLLNDADIIIDLTRMPYCLVCGAYEALALSKPMILTDDPAGRELFPKGVVFTGLTINEIEESLILASQSLPQLQADSALMKDLFITSWLDSRKKLEQLLLN